MDAILQQVSQLESSTQPDPIISEQSLTGITGPSEQRLNHVAESPTLQNPGETQPSREATTDASAQSSTDPLPWGKRPENDDPDYKEIIYWSPVKSYPKIGELSRILDCTARVIQDAFSKTFPSEKCLGVKRKYPALDSVYTKCTRWQ